MRWANDGSHATCRTDSRESWNRMVFAIFAFTICATPVPVYCSRTTCRWKKFRNGSDTATSLLRQIFTRILTINQKYLRQKQCWQDWAWVDVQHSSLLNNEKILTKPILSGFLLYGGELGIRTLGSFWEHSISSAAPSTTRTTLRICNSAFLPKKNWKELTERTTKYLIFKSNKPLNLQAFQAEQKANSSITLRKINLIISEQNIL